jgi:flagellar motor switch protein FliG
MAAHRLGAGGRNLTRASSDLHRRIQRLRKVLNTSKEAVEKLEVSLEPCVTDADLAFHSFDGFKDQATILNEHVRKTTEAISAENRLIQDLSERARA